MRHYRMAPGYLCYLLVLALSLTNSVKRKVPGTRPVKTLPNAFMTFLNKQPASVR